jgi:hypothetical protein
MELWAFGVSPDGLGLQPSFFWALSTPEFEAIKRVHDRKEQRWAFERAEFRNGHFSTDGVPWVPGDFLGASTRENRKAEDFHMGMEVRRLNQELATMKAGDTHGVPDVFLQIAKNQDAIVKRNEERNAQRG